MFSIWVQVDREVIISFSDNSPLELPSEKHKKHFGAERVPVSEIYWLSILQSAMSLELIRAGGG